VVWFTGMYTDVLRRLSGAVRRKRPLKWRTNRFLLHDNAPAHRSVLDKDFLAKLNVTTQDLLSTSPFERNEHWRDGAFVIIKNAYVELNRLSKNGFKNDLYNCTVAGRSVYLHKVVTLEERYLT